MLQRDKLFKELSRVTHSFIKDFNKAQEFALALWAALLAESDYHNKLETFKSSYAVPSWSGSINANNAVALQQSPYTVISVDGSQIYPDRHQGFECYLINIGTVVIQYQACSTILLDSEPLVMLRENAEDVSPEAVNCYRSEEELKRALILGEQFLHHKPLVLFDGSLIMWHLEGKEKTTKEYFLTRSLEIMKNFKTHNILHAGYISMPKSKELINILRRACEMGMGIAAEGHIGLLDLLVDTTIAHFFLTPHMRSIVFKNRSISLQEYPEALQPYFFYINNGYEIVRIEIPAWIAERREDVDLIARICLDQAIKGNGYPVCLREAHEQAVVKNHDREFFYQLMHRLSQQHGYAYPTSQKSLKKRSVDI